MSKSIRSILSFILFNLEGYTVTQVEEQIPRFQEVADVRGLIQDSGGRRLQREGILAGGALKNFIQTNEGYDDAIVKLNNFQEYLNKVLQEPLLGMVNSHINVLAGRLRLGGQDVAEAYTDGWARADLEGLINFINRVSNYLKGYSPPREGAFTKHYNLGEKSWRDIS